MRRRITKLIIAATAIAAFAAPAAVTSSAVTASAPHSAPATFYRG